MTALLIIPTLLVGTAIGILVGRAIWRALHPVDKDPNRCRSVYHDAYRDYRCEGDRGHGRGHFNCRMWHGWENNSPGTPNDADFWHRRKGT